GADNRAQVTWVGDVVQDDEHAGLLLLRGLGDEVVDIGVLVRRDLQADALVHAIAGHLVHDVALDFQNGQVAGIGDGYCFRQALIAAGSLRNIQVGGRNLGVQAFDNGVASHNHLRGFFFMPTRIAALTVQLRLVLGVVNAVFCLRGWAFAFYAFAALAASAFNSTFFIRFTGACAAAAVCTCHKYFSFIVV